MFSLLVPTPSDRV